MCMAGNMGNKLFPGLKMFRPSISKSFIGRMQYAPTDGKKIILPNLNKLIWIYFVKKYVLDIQALKQLFIQV